MSVMNGAFTLMLVAVLVIGLGALASFLPHRVESVAREIFGRIHGPGGEAQTQRNSTTAFRIGGIGLVIAGVVLLIVPISL